MLFYVGKGLLNQLLAYAAALKGGGHFGMRQDDDIAGATEFDKSGMAFHHQLKLVGFFVELKLLSDIECSIIYGCGLQQQG